MGIHFVSATDEKLFDAIDAILACVPKPWTQRMVWEAVAGVLHVADGWRGKRERQVEDHEVVHAYLAARRGMTERQIAYTDVVAA